MDYRELSSRVADYLDDLGMQIMIVLAVVWDLGFVSSKPWRPGLVRPPMVDRRAGFVWPACARCTHSGNLRGLNRGRRSLRAPGRRSGMGCAESIRRRESHPGIPCEGRAASLADRTGPVGRRLAAADRQPDRRHGLAGRHERRRGCSTSSRRERSRPESPCRATAAAGWSPTGTAMTWRVLDLKDDRHRRGRAHRGRARAAGRRDRRPTARRRSWPWASATRSSAST